MDNFQHITKILDIGINSALERVLHIAQIDSIRNLLHPSDTSLGMLKFKKGDILTPVPDYQTANYVSS